MSAASTDRPNVENIEKALTVGAGIGQRDPARAAEHVDRASFVQHNLDCADGVEGLEEFISVLPAEPSPLRVVRVLQDGPFVVTHSEGDIFGAKVFFDIYRFADGRIVEHWDNLAERAGPNDSGRSATDGPTEPSPHVDTEATKALVGRFFDAVFVRGDDDAIAEYVDGDRLLQHHVAGRDGVGALRERLDRQRRAGRAFTEVRVEQVLGEGDFALVTASGMLDAQPHAIYDLFRVEHGAIAEHWDVLQSIPPEDRWRNPHGKF